MTTSLADAPVPRDGPFSDHPFFADMGHTQRAARAHPRRAGQGHTQRSPPAPPVTSPGLRTTGDSPAAQHRSGSQPVSSPPVDRHAGGYGGAPGAHVEAAVGDEAELANQFPPRTPLRRSRQPVVDRVAPDAPAPNEDDLLLGALVSSSYPIAAEEARASGAPTSTTPDAGRGVGSDGEVAVRETLSSSPTPAHAPAVAVAPSTTGHLATTDDMQASATLHARMDWPFSRRRGEPSAGAPTAMLANSHRPMEGTLAQPSIPDTLVPEADWQYETVAMLPPGSTQGAEFSKSAGWRLRTWPTDDPTTIRQSARRLDAWHRSTAQSIEERIVDPTNLRRDQQRLNFIAFHEVYRQASMQSHARGTLLKRLWLENNQLRNRLTADARAEQRRVKRIESAIARETTRAVANKDRTARNISHIESTLKRMSAEFDAAESKLREQQIAHGETVTRFSDDSGTDDSGSPRGSVAGAGLMQTLGLQALAEEELFPYSPAWSENDDDEYSDAEFEDILGSIRTETERDASDPEVTAAPSGTDEEPEAAEPLTKSPRPAAATVASDTASSDGGVDDVLASDTGSVASKHSEPRAASPSSSESSSSSEDDEPEPEFSEEQYAALNRASRKLRAELAAANAANAAAAAYLVSLEKQRSDEDGVHDTVAVLADAETQVEDADIDTSSV